MERITYLSGGNYFVNDSIVINVEIITAMRNHNVIYLWEEPFYDCEANTMNHWGLTFGSEFSIISDNRMSLIVHSPFTFRTMIFLRPALREGFFAIWIGAFYHAADFNIFVLEFLYRGLDFVSDFGSHISMSPF
jgi:hypothetical protein